jgi:hypothetical protein
MTSASHWPGSLGDRLGRGPLRTVRDFVRDKKLPARLLAKASVGIVLIAPDAPIVGSGISRALTWNLRPAVLEWALCGVLTAVVVAHSVLDAKESGRRREPLRWGGAQEPRTRAP